MLRHKNSVEESHYDLLSVKEDASYEEIRTSYRVAILNYHPDKLQNTRQMSHVLNEVQDRFLKIQKAWEILGNSKLRAVYDSELRASRKDRGDGVGVAAEDVNLEDMEIEDGGEVLELFYQCRCGDYFSVDSLELGKMGYTLLRDENKALPIILVRPKARQWRNIVCARCHSLRHYGKVKDPTVENLLPEFDFDHTVGRRLVSAIGARSVVLLVVDAVDFDGSFPKKVAKLVSEAIEENFTAWKEGKSGNVPRIVLVVTKLDLLPTSLSPTRLEHWVRQRAREGGAGVIKKVHFVSAVKDWGLKDLVEDVITLAGPRGNVWAVGMQNAGKSTLINAMGKWAGGNEGKLSLLTEAPVPGTTLGIVKVEGVLPGQAKLFDTPGLLNPHQITTRLTRDEQKLVHISKELKPRTYRVKEGHSVHIGGLIRLDIEELSADSVYVTVWASPYLPLHMGKTENASTMLEDHFGLQLQPPIGEKRVQELGKWVRKEFHISGSNWDSSSVDIAAAGLGWFAIGLKGEAVLGAWTYEGVDVVLRNSLIPFRSQIFEVAGFTVSKIVSKADQALNKSMRLHENKRKRSVHNVTAADKSLSLMVDAGTNSC
ncbi:hypothetical protein GH714_027145 [Hevea brasiliensis]|uniref:J domain-containing protein n=1 Tax=Hevea brasiliensis TaxID=3981 RepID=A0A6A6MRG8_HEVBR|nr:hypothetical protein GH714_027145 [Hevea brasiliensis]